MKIFIIIAIVVVIPIILYFSLSQTITDMAYDIAVKNGDDCKLLTEKDLMERYKMYKNDLRCWKTYRATQYRITNGKNKIPYNRKTWKYE